MRLISFGKDLVFIPAHGNKSFNLIYAKSLLLT